MRWPSLHPIKISTLPEDALAIVLSFRPSRYSESLAITMPRLPNQLSRNTSGLHHVESGLQLLRELQSYPWVFEVKYPNPYSRRINYTKV
jgi:hypothetical protein